MPFEHSLNTIRDYALGNKYTAHADTVRMYDSLRVHANGELPERLICNRRPGESDRIKEYRMDIYEPMTKSPISKIITSMAKIRRSPDWSIQFKNGSARIIHENETLEKYIKENYPKDFSSFENWLFNVAIKEYFIDSNAVILVKPLTWEVPTTGYLKPFPFIYNSTQVLDFKYDEYAVLLSEEKCVYNIVDENQRAIAERYDGMVIIVVDDERIYRYEQIDQHKRFIEVENIIHGLSFMPAFKMPGMFFKVCEGITINESRINAMLPDLNEAARIYSDLQAEFVQHIHSDRWEYMNTKCTHCNGTGQIIPEQGDTCNCAECKGSGYVPTSPYTVRVLTPPEIGQEAMPSPPAGYIQKTDVAEMCEKLRSEVSIHLYGALAAVNMQNLEQVPLNISGVAKEVDRDEQSNFIHSVAEDLVYIGDKIIYMSNEYRTKDLITDPAKRKELLPSIPVPERFDLLTIKDVRDEVGEAKKQNLSGYTVSILESEYAAKKFQNQPEIADHISLSYTLDPLMGLSEEEKISRLNNNGVSQIDYIISSNIIPFIKRAIRENKDFKMLPEDKQLEILLAYGIEKEKTISLRGRLEVAAIDEEEEITDDENTETEEQQ